MMDKMDTDIRDYVEASFVEAYSDHQEALLQIARGSWDGGKWLRVAEETERKLHLSREQVKVLWS